jgi:hypothetical protein
MSNVITMATVPDEAELLTIMKQAAASHLYLITNGRVCRLCSIVPNGWRKVTAMIKEQPEAA